MRVHGDSRGNHGTSRIPLSHQITRYSLSSQTQELDQKIQDVFKRIQTERKVLEASNILRNATTNSDVLRRLDAQIREAERSLSYFETTLRELQARKLNLAQRDDQARSGAPGSSQGDPSMGGRGGWSSDGNRNAPSSPDIDPSGRSRRNTQSPELRPLSTTDAFGPPQPKGYVNLDLVKADTPLSPAKISRMLHQLEFKLKVEMEYKTGIDKMARLYQVDGDKKSRADAESKRVESDRKIQLLQTALRRYKNLHILDDVDDDENTGKQRLAFLTNLALKTFIGEEGGFAAGPGLEGERTGNLRSKPLSGKLQITLKGAREIDHAPRTRSSHKGSETYISLRVEDTQRARSHASRTDRWMEDFEITVDKASELEIAVYDKHVGEPNPILIGLMWIKISDLVDAQRKQKVLMDGGLGGWVTAGAMNGDPSAPTSAGHLGGDMNSPIEVGNQPMLSSGPNEPSASQGEGIDAWFSVEPAGALALRLNFGESDERLDVIVLNAGLSVFQSKRTSESGLLTLQAVWLVKRPFASARVMFTR